MFIYRARRSSRAKRFEQSAAVERLEHFELHVLLLYVSTFHYCTVLVLSFGPRIFRILLSFAKRLDILTHLNLWKWGRKMIFD